MNPTADLSWATVASVTTRRGSVCSRALIPGPPSASASASASTSTSTSASSASSRRRGKTSRISRPHLPATAILLLMCKAFASIQAFMAVAAVEAGKTGGGLSLVVDHAPCVRLFHSGGDVGCRTPGRDGVTGPLLLVDSDRVLHDIEALGHSSLQAEEGQGHKREQGSEHPHDTAARAADSLKGMGDGLIAILPEALFNGSVLDRLSATGLLGGVMVLAGENVSPDVAGNAYLGVPDGVHVYEEGGDAAGDRGGRLLSSSSLDGSIGSGAQVPNNPDVSTPQGAKTPSAAFDIDASYPWNSNGDGMLMESFDFPVVLVTGDSVEEVRRRAASNGDLGGSSWEYPLHRGRMTFYFGGSDENLNSQECLGWTDINGDRAPQCKPLGGQSSWASIGSPGVGSKETVFAVTGMDSTSMFHDRAPGANSAVSGLVALLAAAESLGAIGRSGSVDFSALPRQIVFAAFQAEAYGFTGSRRFLQDWRGSGVSCENRVDSSVSPTGMEACLDPLYPSLEFQKLGPPAHVISVDQVGCLPESTLWIHPSPGASAENQGMVSKLSPSGGVIALSNSTKTELPPSPLTAFVKADPQLSGFVLAGYDEDFSCPNYHSRLDTRATVDSSSVAAAAEVLAMSTLVLAGGSEVDAKSLTVNATLVETLLGCFLEDWSCDTMKEYVIGELSNLEEVLGFRVSVKVPVPPTMYSGPLEFGNGGGMPTVRHTKGDGSWRLFPSWVGPFDPDHDKIQLVPSLVEIFCRAFLSEQAASAHAGGYGEHECKSSGDCSSHVECNEERTYSRSSSSDNNVEKVDVMDNTDGRNAGGNGDGVLPAKYNLSNKGGPLRRSAEDHRSGNGDFFSLAGGFSRGDSSGSAGVPRPECVRGRCACPSGFHHIALGVGLEREEILDQYRVVDVAVDQGAPLWTEPNWRNIGVEVYLDPGNSVARIAFGVGVAVTAAAGVVSWSVLRSLEKRKLL